MRAPKVPMPSPAVLAAWSFDPGARCECITTGLINVTYRVTDGARSVALQRLHPIFDARVNHDTDAITRMLADKGMITPRVVRTTTDELSFHAPDGVWRALTWLDGRVFQRMESPQRAQAAGRLCGRFHATLDGFRHEFEFQRPDAHDFERHLCDLRRALETHVDHPAHAQVTKLATQIFEHASELPAPAELPQRIIHGDLKLTNLLFDDEGEGLAVIDLDTLAYGRMDVELGDALRSWCNVAGEDELESELSAELLDAALRGFADSGGELLTDAEWRALVPGLERIALELSSRFASDALLEQRFGWDSARFDSRSAHNLLRASGQLSLAHSVRAKRTELLERVEAIRLSVRARRRPPPTSAP